jgi:hypothetical protein
MPNPHGITVGVERRRDERGSPRDITQTPTGVQTAHGRRELESQNLNDPASGPCVRAPAPGLVALHKAPMLFLEHCCAQCHPGAGEPEPLTPS